ncbi:MAG: FAD-binding oxidoreductase [Thermoplasmata archaeon]
MAVGYRDFMGVLRPVPALERLPEEELVKIVYLRDKRALPDAIKRLFDQAAVIPMEMEETRDVAEAMRFASGETAGVNLGGASGTIHYVRRSLEMLKDRDLSVDWGPRADPLEGDVLPLFDGLLLDLSKFKGVEVRPEANTLRAEAGATWRDVSEAAQQAGLLLPLFPVLPTNPYMGDVIAGSALLSSFAGGPETYIRNVDLLGPDTSYSQSGFDLVPNNATGYDLNSLLLVMGRNLGIPVSLTFQLLPINRTRAVRFSFDSWEGVLTALQTIAKAPLEPLRVVFGDPVASAAGLDGGEGYTLEVDLGAAEEVLPGQEETLQAAVGEETPGTGSDGLGHLHESATREKGPFHLAEIQTSLADLPPLWEELATWVGVRGSAFGLAGSLREGGTVHLLPFMRGDLRGTSTTGGPVDQVLHRGDRFNRITELVKIAQRHPCRVRNTQVGQLLAGDTQMRKRFALARRIKRGVDLGNIINPSGLLWVPPPR